MKLSVSSWSLCRELPLTQEMRRYLIRTRYLPKETTGQISLIDFPKVCVREFGANAVELCQMNFLSTDWDYIEQVRDASKRAGVVVVNIPVDIGSQIGSGVAEADPVKRRKQFQKLRLWFDIAKALDSPSIRVNTGKDTDKGALQRAIGGYKQLVKTAEQTGVKVLIENHGGISEKPDNIIRIVEAVGSEYLGVCPDLGNLPADTRYEGLEKIAEYAVIVHAKTYDFDQKGKETTINMKRCVDIFKQKGFDGYYSVEFEGKGNQREGVRKSLALLRKYL